MARWAMRLPPLAMALLAVLFIAGARNFRPEAALVPVMIGWTVLALATIEFASRLEGRVGDFINRLFRPSQGLGPALAPANVGRQATAIGGLVALVGGFVVIGVLPACAIFIFAAMRFGAGLSWRVSLLAGVALAMGVWLVFTQLLGLGLPAGLLFDRGA